MTDEEEELRAALRSRAEAVPLRRADEPGLVHRLAAARRRRAQGRMAASGAALALLLAVAVLASADGDTPSNVVAGPDPSATTTALAPATTAVPATTVETAPAPAPTGAAPTTAAPRAMTTTSAKPGTTAAPRPPVPADALWPKRLLAKTFSTPDRAVEDFARGFLRMRTPQIGSAQVSGSEARVEVRPLPNASITTVVTLRREASWGWVVVGCAAASIQIDSPATGATINSPLTVRGRAHAFEGTVELALRLDPDHTIGDAFGTGGSDQMLPFEATMTFPAAGVREGSGGRPVPVVLVVTEPRADDAGQGPAAATVVRLIL